MALIDNLVSYYKMDTSWSFPDAHWSNTWTINWATYTASWKINWWYSFDWTNDYVDCWDTTWLRLLWNYSIFFWVKFNSLTGTQRLVNKDNADDFSGGYSLTYSSADWITSTHNNWTNKNWGTGYHPTVSTWTQIWITFDWTNRRLYVNWSQQGSNFATSWNVVWETNRLFLWTYWATTWLWQYLNWTLDELWLWERALSAAEVTELYNAWAWLTYPFTVWSSNNNFFMFFNN